MIHLRIYFYSIFLVTLFFRQQCTTTLPTQQPKSRRSVSRKADRSETLCWWIFSTTRSTMGFLRNASRTAMVKQLPTNEGSLRGVCGRMCPSRTEHGVVSLIHYPLLPCVCFDLTSGGLLLICWMWNINSHVRRLLQGVSAPLALDQGTRVNTKLILPNTPSASGTLCYCVFIWCVEVAGTLHWLLLQVYTL